MSTDSTPTSDPNPSALAAFTGVVHQDVVAALAQVDNVIDSAATDLAAASAVSDYSVAFGSASVLTAAVTPDVALSSSTSTGYAAKALVAPAIPPLPPAAPANSIAVLLGSLFSLANSLIAPNPSVPETNPLQLLLFSVVRNIEIGLGLVPVGSIPGTGTGANPGPTTGVPTPGDVAHTQYGDIGIWLLKSDGEISDYGGQVYGGKKLLEPVNVIIIDPTSTTPEQSTAKLNAALTAAGFPSQLGHSTGFQGTINGMTYGQQPSGFLQAYSDNFFLFPGNHARAFGPAPAQDGKGYVWTAAASSEVFGLYGLVPTHTYVSYDAARDALANGLANSGATSLGTIALGNAYNTSTVTTGDNDGNAVVIRLN